MTGNEATGASDATPNWISGPAWPGVAVRTTTRHWGGSLPPYDRGNLGLHVGDDVVAVQRNRACLSRALPGEPLWLNQVHGSRVVNADHPSARPGLDADGAYSGQAARVLAVMTADCLPVVVAEPSGRGVVVLHAGWRGLAQGILQTGVARLSRYVQLPASALEAWVGPAIGGEAYQVGDEVREAFGANGAGHFIPDPAAPDKWLFHLAGQAGDLLRQAGVAAVHQSGYCTYNDAQWFSYRRDGRTGRFVTLAWVMRAPQARAE